MVEAILMSRRTTAAIPPQKSPQRRKTIGTYIRERSILDLCIAMLRDYAVPANAGGGGSSRLKRTQRGKRMPLFLLLQ